MDAEDTRVIPHSIREYLSHTRETAVLFRWAIRELKTPEISRWTKRLLFWLAVMTVVQVLQPRFLSYVFDGLLHRDKSSLVFGLLSFFFCLVIQRWMDKQQGTAREWLAGLIWGTLDRTITTRYFGKSMGQHTAEGWRLSVPTIDKGRWRLLDIQNVVFTEAIPSFLALTASFLLLWILSPVAGMIMTAVILIYLAWMLYLNQKVMEVCAPIDAKIRKLNRYIVERWENIERVKTNAKEDEELAFITSEFNRHIAEDRAFWLWFVKQSMYRKLAGVIGLALIYGYGAWLVWHGKMALGLIYPLFSWSGQIVDSIWRIGQVEHLINWNMPTIKAMIDGLSIPPDVISKSDGVDISDAKEITITFEEITHTYPVGTEDIVVEDGRVATPVIKGVSFTINPGEKVALIGPSGCGKTTLMRLLLRFMDPNFGRLLINGIDLRDIRLDSWMKIVGYIPQHAQILDGSLRYNLDYGLSPIDRSGLSNDKVWEFMRFLQIDFGTRLSEGLATHVGKHGVKLSGGQAQRVMIGAAAIKKPRFMIIDEATSHLDSSTERAVHLGLAEILRSDVGALIVAHRLSTIRACDKFIILRSLDELRDGESQIEAVGDSFEGLCGVSPTLRRLADDQHMLLHSSSHVA